MNWSLYKITLPKDFVILKILISIIYATLELYYKYFISNHFNYMGYADEFNMFYYLITKIFFILLLIMSYDIYKRSQFLYTIYLVLIFFFYIPNAILFSFADFSFIPFLANVFFVSCFIIASYFKFSFPLIFIHNKHKESILIAITIIFLIPILVTFKLNINLNTLFLSEIYETRDIFSKDLRGYLAYLYNLEAKAIIPIALVFFLIRSKYWLVGLFFFILLYLFVISGNKIVYFTSLILLVFYYIGTNYVSKITNFFLVTIILFLLFPIIDNYFLNSPVFMGTFINRFLFIPALLNHFYFDYFDGQPLFFAESNFFNLFFKSPYEMPVGFFITKIYWNGSGAYGNNGIVSDGYMNLGYIGVFLFSILFSLLFSLFNSFNLHKGYYGVFFSFIYIILSVPLLTCFITGGILIFIILAYFILSNDSSKVGTQLNLQ